MFASRFTKPKQLANQTYNQIVAEELERKRPYEAKYRTYCSKCGRDIEIGQEYYYYGNGKKLCIGDHEQIVENLKLYVFF